MADGCALLVKREQPGSNRFALLLLVSYSTLARSHLQAAKAAPGWAYAHSTVAQEVARISHNTATKQ